MAVDNKQKVVVLKDFIVVNNKLVRKNDAYTESPNYEVSLNSNCRNNEEVAPIDLLQGTSDCTKNTLEEECDEENPLLAEAEYTDTFAWGRKAILLMLDEYRKRKSKFRNPKFKKKVLWREIADVMNRNNYDVDANTLDRKMRNMKSTFCKIKDNNRKGKTGKGRIHWEFYTSFEEIFADDKTVNVTNCVSSIPLTEEINVDIQASANEETPLPSPASSTQSSNPSNCAEKQKKLDMYRRKQLEIEEDRLQELKKIRLEMEKSNSINEAKVELFKLYVEHLTSHK